MLANAGFGAMLGPTLQRKMTKPLDKALSATEMDEPNKVMERMMQTGMKKGGSVSSARKDQRENSMKRIKKMAGGALTDSSGNTVRSSDGEEVSYGEPRSNSRPDIDESIWDLKEKAANTGYGGMGSRKAAEPRARKEEAKSEEPAKAAQPKFGTAFAEARKAGLKTFEHNGKRYTTQVKDDAPKKAPEVKREEPAVKAEIPGPKKSVSRQPQPGDAEYGRQSFGNASKSTFVQRQQGSDGSEEMGKPPKKKLPVSENMWFQREAMGKNYSPLKAKNLKKGGLASSASSRADGIAQRGKTRGRMV
jgi:hypothetical protein